MHCHKGAGVLEALVPEPAWLLVQKLTAGLGHWSIHELRHICASHSLHEEVPLEVVSEQMGHTSIRVTNDVYGYLMPRSRQKTATAMEGVLFTADDVRPGQRTYLAEADMRPRVAGRAESEYVYRGPGLEPRTGTTSDVRVSASPDRRSARR